MIAQAKEHGGIIWMDVEEPSKISLATDEDDFEDFPGWKALGQGHIKIIFADEPTGNLDNKNAKNIFSLLNDLAKINDTVLMVATHDDQLTQMLDKRIAIISGEIKSL